VGCGFVLLVLGRRNITLSDNAQPRSDAFHGIQHSWTHWAIFKPSSFWLFCLPFLSQCMVFLEFELLEASFCLPFNILSWRVIPRELGARRVRCPFTGLAARHARRRRV